MHKLIEIYKKVLFKIKTVMGFVPDKDNMVFDFLPAHLEVKERPPSPVGRTMFWILLSLLLVFFIWICIGKIDEVAVAQGKVIPSGYTQSIQAEDKGVVKKINVKNGSHVKKGDVLIELDSTMTEADLNSLEKECRISSLELARLQAEEQNKPFIMPTNIGNISPEEFMLQDQLYRSRKAEYDAKLVVAQQNAKQAVSSRDATRENLGKAKIQLELATTRERKIGELVQAGAVGSFQHLDYLEKKLVLQQEVSSQEIELIKAEDNVIQQEKNLASIIEANRTDIVTKIVETQKKLNTTKEELVKAKEKNRFTKITSPVDGMVHQLAINTVGGVVTAAQTLMLVVPENQPIEIEAWAENKDIGFIHVGQKAEIKIETFNFQRYGTLDATVVDVSSDAVEDKEKGLTFRVLLKTDTPSIQISETKTLNASPGMAVTAEVKTKEKRIVEYFTDSFIKYKSETFRER